MNIRESWEYTIGNLAKAFSLINESDRNKNYSEICLYEEYVEHNELELAINALEAIKLTTMNREYNEWLAKAYENIGLLSDAMRLRKKM